MLPRSAHPLVGVQTLLYVYMSTRPAALHTRLDEAQVWVCTPRGVACCQAAPRQTQYLDGPQGLHQPKKPLQLNGGRRGAPSASAIASGTWIDGDALNTSSCCGNSSAAVAATRRSGRPSLALSRSRMARQKGSSTRRGVACAGGAALRCVRHEMPGERVAARHGQMTCFGHPWGGRRWLCSAAGPPDGTAAPPAAGPHVGRQRLPSCTDPA